MKRPHFARSTTLWLLLVVGSCRRAGTAPARPEDTEVWQPTPPVVTSPAPESSARPSDAIALFDGASLDEWVNTRDGSPAAWTVVDRYMVVNKAAGNIETRRRFRNYQLHLEWRVPADVTGTGQARGNGGVFLASTGGGDRGYELQILDSYHNDTYVNGMAGSIYKQSPPLANPSRKPGEWQSYDVVWHAPTFGADGALTAPARVTVFFNGVARARRLRSARRDGVRRRARVHEPRGFADQAASAQRSERAAQVSQYLGASAAVRR